MNNHDMMDDMSDQAQKHADYLVAARRLAAWDEVPVGVQDDADFEIRWKALVESVKEIEK